MLRRRILTAALTALVSLGTLAFAQTAPTTCPRPDCPNPQCTGTCPRDGSGNPDCPNKGQCPRDGSGQQRRGGNRGGQK